MDREVAYQKLTQLFAEKINYDGELSTLFFIEKEKPNNQWIIKFLNKHHYDFILEHLRNDILQIYCSDIKFDYLNLKTSPITLKTPHIKPKEKVELPTIKNKTIKQIEQFMFDEYEKIWEEQKAYFDDENYLQNAVYISNFGQMQFIGKLYSWLKTIKDYDNE